MGILYLILISVILIWLLSAAGLVYALTHPRRKTFAVALGKGDPTDPADLELDAQAVTFSLTDKLRTPGWIIEGKQPAGPTIVIVHGFGDSRYGALKRSPLWLDFARKVVVFDMPGQGESESPRGYGGLREPDDLLAVLGQLEPDDAKQILLMGVSIGGGIAIAAAAKAEEQVRQSILGVIAESPYRYWDQPLHNLFRYRRYPRYPIIPLTGVWLGLTTKGFKDFDRAHHAAKLGCPLLVIHGSEDGLCPPQAGREIAQAAPDGTYFQIDGAGHEDLPFEHEQAYRAAVSDFLQKLCESGGSVKIEGLAEADLQPTPDGSPI